MTKFFKDIKTGVAALGEIIRLLTELVKLSLANSLEIKKTLGEMRAHTRSVEAAAQDIELSHKAIQDTLHLLGLIQQKHLEIEAEQKQKREETKWDKVF